jgi:hypothetical protein
MESLDYWSRLAPWYELLGKGNLCVRPFERSQWVDGSFTKDFLSSLGISGTSALPAVPGCANVSFSASITELLRRTNHTRNGEGQRQALRLLRNVVPPAILYDGAAGHAYLPPEEQVEFVSRFANSNRRIAVEWMGREDGRLFHEEVDLTSSRETEALSDEAMAALLRDSRRWLEEASARPACPYGPRDAERLGFVSPSPRGSSFGVAQIR